MLASLPSLRQFVLDALISFKLTRVKTLAKSRIDSFILDFLPDRIFAMRSRVEEN